MGIRILKSIDSIDPQQWNALNTQHNPFLRHEFLLALERHGCVSRTSGWTPQHLVLTAANGAVTGVCPAYLKRHSWGEFVFDWRWANAYARAGLNYYPKLVCAVPFTPATGPRLLVSPLTDTAAARAQLSTALRDLAQERSLSSAHVLFPLAEEHDALAAAHFQLRQDCQFHWHNRGYTDFEHFISTFRADKRKKALRERRRITEAGVEFVTLHGAEMTPELWRVVFAFSAATFQAHGHEHYLNVSFFQELSSLMPDTIMVKLARFRTEPIAAAIFFQGGGRLYGRYWGAADNFHSLHFETCYYQGIEYCIEHGIEHFEPGTQGEHKVARGFEPAATYSAHWLADARFAQAISEYLPQERRAVQAYMEEVHEHLPFRRDLSLLDVND